MHSSTDLSANAAFQAMFRPVTGHAYEATKVTRSVWKLADGTVITHESESKLARDDNGRVREAIEENRATSVGGHQSNKVSETITISDPVDHALVMISDPKLKIAMRMALPDLSSGASGKFAASLAGIPPPPANGSAALAPTLGVVPPPMPRKAVRMGDPVPLDGVALGKSAADQVRTEELGKQSLSGVLVIGKRTTTTIPLGEIGNDRPITILHEEWYSPDLQVVVKSLDNDPRSGERTMELQGLTLGPPAAALFQVPPDYTVRDAGDIFRALGTLGRSTAAGPANN